MYLSPATSFPDTVLFRKVTVVDSISVSFGPTNIFGLQIFLDYSIQGLPLYILTQVLIINVTALILVTSMS